MKVKRKDKLKEISNSKPDLHHSIQQSPTFATQNILLLVEGDTENAYFNRLKNNICLNGSMPFFEIKNQEKSYQPIIDRATYFPNEHLTLELFYNIPKPLPTDLVLVFKDPRQRSKSSTLFILIE